MAKLAMVPQRVPCLTEVCRPLGWILSELCDVDNTSQQWIKATPYFTVRGLLRIRSPLRRGTTCLRKENRRNRVLAREDYNKYEMSDKEKGEEGDYGLLLM
ncbi:hypothetical protein TREMEDRAFT_65847 [Tremella mesenterica DSM 1558]|uniref:uncharacterized protein n=1 Tax=Tremella mesenterica (strain ATCC 24925 / CBS 8224 / DSM 1558 / NBRC 9311 / NRRL Y-6157 / RJB 2259-6 / UBC 559-6) TaxID=578456 RepID=UPI00032C15BA|nr:uncharacterized protein TREMEDRAFT_65847 [Tremella mesenterica DSM 1558]EIW66236.1 hypothetical protein TREMEDRAFT_65847 [Tremella mesenterica DSM 1558]